MSLSRAFQWAGVAAVLLILVGLNYEFESKAGMQMNAAPESPLSQSLRGYWKLDDGSGTNATDSSGNANTLAMTGSPSWVAGQIGPYSLDFSGTAQYLSVADPASGVLDFGDGADFTISGWFNRDTAAADHTIVAKKNDQTTNAGYVVWIDNNGSTDYLSAEISDGTDTYSAIGTTDLSTTGWHQFSIVWDDSNGLSIYLDGKLDGSTTSSTSSINSLANALAFRIGAESDAGVPFDGKIDDIRVYGYALSADQVKKLYNTTAPTQPIDTSLVGHWTFDGTDIQGTTAIDRSSFGNNGTITGTTKTIGKLGQALSFNGSGDITIGDPSSGVLDFGTSQAFSVSLWVNLNDTGIFNPLFSKTGSDVSQGYAMSFDSAALTMYVNDAVDRCDWSFSSGVAAGTWYNIVWTVTGARQSSVYINGNLQDSHNCSLSDDLSNSDDFSLGYMYSGGNQYFSGKIDDVRIYNRILSSAEITNLYTLGR